MAVYVGIDGVVRNINNIHTNNSRNHIFHGAAGIDNVLRTVYGGDITNQISGIQCDVYSARLYDIAGQNDDGGYSLTNMRTDINEIIQNFTLYVESNYMQIYGNGNTCYGKYAELIADTYVNFNDGHKVNIARLTTNNNGISASATVTGYASTGGNMTYVVAAYGEAIRNSYFSDSFSDTKVYNTFPQSIVTCGCGLYSYSSTNVGIRFDSISINGISLPITMTKSISI